MSFNLLMTGNHGMTEEEDINLRKIPSKTLFLKTRKIIKFF